MCGYPEIPAIDARFGRVLDWLSDSPGWLRVRRLRRVIRIYDRLVFALYGEL